MSTARAYCKTGVIGKQTLCRWGICRSQGRISPLQSAKIFDPKTSEWSEVPSMPCSKAQVMPSTSPADIQKPMASGLTTYGAKLCVSKLVLLAVLCGCWSGYYDPKSSSLVEMTIGMAEGWPPKQAVTKLSAVVDNDLYALNLSGSSDSAKLKVYDHQDDTEILRKLFPWKFL